MAPRVAPGLPGSARPGPDGLIPCVVQDAEGGRVLMVAWMNEDSLARTIETGQTWFWSRSRGELWHKGATSGNTQTVRELLLDCDGDTLLAKVDPAGPACHTGAEDCFSASVDYSGEEPFSALADLERTIAERALAGDADSSYTASLLAKGIDTVCKKVGEEATEVVLAAKGDEREQVIYESADLLYHLLVLLRASGVDVREVAAELDSRRPKP